jgi:hypothetical protein
MTIFAVCQTFFPAPNFGQCAEKNIDASLDPFSISFFLNVGPLKEGIFLTTFYGLYFSHQLHMLQITIIFFLI